MNLKDAVIEALKALKAANKNEITEYIKSNGLFVFETKTPAASVSATITIIRQNNNLIGQVGSRPHKFYLTDSIDINKFFEKPKPNKDTESLKVKSENELHQPVKEYLVNYEDIYAKTIRHQCSGNSDSNKVWTHPDIIGVKFLTNQFENKTTKQLYKLRNNLPFDLYSYELKREIKNDSDLKIAFLEAAANSGWANYGYLVANYIDDSLNDEILRLNTLFGIGVMVFSTKKPDIIVEAQRHNIDYNTIDKLCGYNNKDINAFFNKLIDYINYQEKDNEALETFSVEDNY
jgi:hypothetical protein